MVDQFSSAELSDMQSCQSDHMLDTGNIQPRTQAQDSYNQDVETWPTNSADLACGIDMRPGSERFTNKMTLTSYDATARLPITATPKVGDRFRVTKRFGVALVTPLVFRIVSPIQQGPSGIRIILQKVDV